MFAQTKVAPLWQEGRDWYPNTLSDPDYSSSLSTVSIVEAGIAQIDAATVAARYALTDEARAHYRRLVEDLSNHLAENVLRMRKPGHGRRVPPTLTALRAALALHRKIDAARWKVYAADVALRAAWASPDLAIWCTWESEMWKKSRAESQLAKFEREAAPWK